MRYIIILLLCNGSLYGQKATIYGEVLLRTADSIELNFPNSMYYDPSLSIWTKVGPKGEFSFTGKGGPSCMAVLRYDGREQELFIYPGEKLEVRLEEKYGPKLFCSFYGPGARANIFLMNALQYEFELEGANPNRWTLDSVRFFRERVHFEFQQARLFVEDSVKLDSLVNDKLETECWYHLMLTFAIFNRKYFRERTDMVGREMWLFVRNQLLKYVPKKKEYVGSITGYYWKKEYERLKAEDIAEK